MELSDPFPIFTVMLHQVLIKAMNQPVKWGFNEFLVLDRPILLMIQITDLDKARDNRSYSFHSS